MAELLTQQVCTTKEEEWLEWRQNYEIMPQGDDEQKVIEMYERYFGYGRE